MRRIRDLKKNIQGINNIYFLLFFVLIIILIKGIHHELNGLREMTDVISEATMFRVQESLQVLIINNL